MKRFSRRNNQQKTQQETPNRKIKTEMDDFGSSNSQSTTKNKSLDDGSFENRVFYPKPIAFLMFTLLKAKAEHRLSFAFGRIKQKFLKKEGRVQKLLILHTLNGKINFKLKTQVINKLRNIKNQYNNKNKSIAVFNNFSNKIARKLKMESLLKLINYMNNNIRAQNQQLREIEGKYNENSFGEEYMKEYKKFVKISPKNVKNFIKATEDYVEATTNALLEGFQSKRIKKNVASDSQIVVTVIKHYIEHVKDVNSKASSTQNQIKTLMKEKEQISSELKDLSKQIDSKTKQLKKYDNDLAQKSDTVIQSAYSIQSLKNLERVISNQIKICEGKQYNGYEYISRCNALKAASMMIKKLLDNIQSPAEKTETEPLNSSRNRPMYSSRKKTQVIQQQNSLEESDVVEEVSRIIDEFILQINSQSTFEGLRSCSSEKNFNSIKKSLQTPQLMKIYRKFQQILTIFCQNKFKAQQVQKENHQLKERLQEENSVLSKEIQSKTNEVLGLNEKIKEIESKLRKNELTKIQERNSIQLQASKKTKELQKELEQINNQLLEKDRKLTEVKDQFKKFKKMLKGSVQKSKERSNSIQEIVQKSLSKSKAAIKTSASKSINSLNDITKRIEINQKLKGTNFFDDATNKSPYSIKKNQITKMSVDNEQAEEVGRNDQKNKKEQELKITINKLTTKLQEAQKKIKQHQAQVKQTEKQSILPENLITMLYNIMVKIKELPQKSQIAQQIWDQLASICQNCNGIQLLMNLQDYSVSWMNDNIKQGQQSNRFKTRLEKQLLSSERSERSRNMQTPKRLSRDRNRANELNKTVKNNAIVNKD